MKLKLKIATVFAISMFVANYVFSQFTLSGEIRPRTEYRHGFKSLADSAQKSAVFTDQRTRLNLAYKSSGFQTYICLQDIRVWGSQSQLNTTDGLSSIHEAWGEAFLSKKLSFKFGRMELDYDDARIFGNVDWAQQARSHDAGVFAYKDSSVTLHVGGAYNQDKDQLLTTSYSIANSYKAMQYLWFHKDAGNLGLSLLALNLGQQVNYKDVNGNSAYQDNYTQTIGTRTTYKKNKLGVAFNGYYQMGSTKEWPARNLQAYLLGLDVTYKVSDPISVTVGFEIQSGNSQTDTTASYAETDHAFNPYYGTNHKFNGNMDYFYVGNHIGSVGLQDIYLQLKYKHKKFNLGVDGHLFMAAADVLDLNETLASGNITSMNSSLGTEIDAYADFKLTEGVKFKAGYSQMFATETMAALKGTYNSIGEPTVFGVNNWAYAMIIIKPTFFTKEN